MAKKLFETLLTPERAQKVLRSVRLGLSASQASEAAGLHKRTVSRWLHRGSQPEAPEIYKRFAKDFRLAEVDQRARLLYIIEQAAKKDWKAAKWLLEQRWPEDYGDGREAVKSVAVKTAIEQRQTLQALSKRELKALQNIYKKLPAGASLSSLGLGDENEAQYEIIDAEILPAEDPDGKA